MASKDYIQEEATTTWQDSGGDKPMPFTGLVAGAVVCGAYLDLGAVPRADEFSFEVVIDGFNAATVVGEDLPIYFAQSEDGLSFDGVPNIEPTTTVAGAYTKAQLPNLLGPVDFLIQTDVTATTVLKITSVVRLTSRYVAPVMLNNTSDVLATTATATHTFKLTPKPREGQ
jgi:hypothetical protein